MQFPEGKTINDLSNLIHRKERTIKKTLNKFLNEGVFYCKDQVWKIKIEEKNQLDEIAQKFGTLGRNLQRKEEHKRERENYTLWISRKE